MTDIVEFIKAISDETRLRIMVLLYTRELCVCELSSILEESQPNVSRHLAKLRNMGLVKDKRQGQFIFYFIDMKDNVATGILNIISDNINSYPLFKKDMQRLSEKLAEGHLCKRENS